MTKREPPAFGYADADAPARSSFRTIERRRERDREFLAMLRALVDAGDKDRLWQLALDLAHGPLWKRIATQRALRKVLADSP